MTRRSLEDWRTAIAVYRQPRVVGMLFLGFAAGLPFPLVFTTLSTWLRDVGVDRTTIGFFAWIGITYSIKVFWSPVVDRAPLLLLTRWLGQRRGWMLLAQATIVAGLLGMARTDPTQDIMAMALFALLVAFASATQDIAIDAYRIEAAPGELQGAMAGMYQSGYRVAAALVGGAGALYLAQYLSWTTSYVVMAVSMFIGILTVLIVREPDRVVSANTVMDEQRVVDYLERAAHVPYVLRIPTAWFIGAVICPFTEFFQRVGWWAMLVLLFIGIYRISDIVLANMAYPFYIDLGFTLSEIAAVTKVFGVVITLFGAAVGGLAVARYGLNGPLVFGAVLLAVTNLFFAGMALYGPELWFLVLTISADNLAAGFTGTV
ncbi:MAG: MFS transporter, partial [Acidiferrobacterales bacterium]|nr:MFS transporter [Acidiferrobacterales bacterium]